jgi:putative aldouronate transport system substrate-binding protein
MLKGFLKTCKLIAVPITIMILISGCGGNNSTVDNTNVEGVAVTKAGELPIVNKEITLTVGYPQSTTIIDFDTNEYTLWLKEQTNINLKFEMFPGTNPTERVQMMLASNSKLPDVLMRVGMTVCCSNMAENKRFFCR